MYIALEVRGENLDPDRVTTLANTKPSFSERKGDVSVSKSGRSSVPSKVGSWRFFTNKIVDSDDVTEHIYEIKRCLNGFQESLSGIDGVDKVWVDVFLSLKVEKDRSSIGGVLLDREFLGLVERHGSEILVSYDAYVE